MLLFDSVLSFKRIILNLKERLFGKAIGAQRINIREERKVSKRIFVLKMYQSFGARSERIAYLFIAPKQRLLPFMLDWTNWDYFALPGDPRLGAGNVSTDWFNI